MRSNLAHVVCIWLLLAVSVLALLANMGCRRYSTVTTQVSAPKMSAPSPLDLRRVQPNEAGVIPILEYHALVPTDHAKGYQYPAAAFRRDVEWLYAHDYRPVGLSDYVQGRIDCPAGMSPVILTFDDALEGQFDYLPDGRINPDCAVAILEDMHSRHPDWALRGTFFVLTDYDPKLPPAFYQRSSSKMKLQHLVQDGFEVGNHTVHHRMGMQHFQDTEVQAEFAGAVAGIHRLLPGYHVDTLALPYGVYPHHTSLVVGGQSGGITYHNICAMEAGYGPAPAPLDARFDPYHIPRIIPGNERFALRYWLDFLEKHKAERFISDGDPNTYTMPASDAVNVSRTRLHQGRYFLRTYQGTQIMSDATAGKG